MPEKMMTLGELSEYLQISEERIRVLVDKKIIVAYKIGGELLRFRKEQIDAIRAEIESRIGEADRIQSKKPEKKPKEKLKIAHGNAEGNNLKDAVSDFLYFNDFYIIAGVIVCILLFVIFKW